ILILKGPDLVVTSVSGPASVGVGGSILVTSRVENASMLDLTSSFRVGLYLSVNTQITTNDLMIGMRRITNGLAAGQNSTAITLVNLPVLAAGHYQLGAIVDDAGEATEADESNNSLAGNPIEITPAQFTSVQLQGSDFVVNFATVAGRNY